MAGEGLRVGQPVDWAYVPRGGWGWPIHVPGVVVRFGAARVCVQVQKVDGTWVERWVSPTTLTAEATR